MRKRVSKREQNKKDIESLLVEIIGAAGAGGATITAIEAVAGYDRHTIVKYLLVLEQRGVIACRPIGKAKVWALNTAPFATVFAGLSQPKSFVEQVLSAAMASVPQGLVLVDSGYKILYANEVANKMNPGSSFVFELFGLENPVRMTRLVALLDNSSTESDARQIILTATNKWYSLSMQAFSKGDQRAVVILIDDITEQKAAQQLIVDQAALLSAERRALDAAAIMAETDLKGVITYANDKFCEISGYSRKELIGNTHKIINSGLHPKAFWANMWKTLQAGKIWQAEIRNRRKDGSYYWVDSVVAPVLDAKKRPIKYLAIRYEITKYKEPALLQNRSKRK